MITKILGGATLVSVLAAVLCFNLWQGAKEDLVAEIAKCNTEHLEAALASANITLDAQRVAYEKRLADADRLLVAERLGRQIASEAAERAEMDSARHEQTIETLELEAQADEIPDSKACLNAYVPRPAVKWLCLQAGHHQGTSGSPGAGNDTVCGDTGGFDSADPALSDFAAITYGGVLARWGHDRKSIVEANGRLLAIEAIQEEVVDD